MVLKYSALKMLADLIESRVPELFGRVCVAPAGKEHLCQWPHLVLQATKWRFVVQDPDDVHPLTGALREPEDGVTVFRVGDWTADVEMRLGSTNAQERYTVGEKIERLFFDGTGSCTELADVGNHYRPGIILADVPGAEARVAYLLGDETWEDEKVFEQQLYSNMMLQVELPILIARYNVPTIGELRLALTESLETIAPGGPLLPGTETVIVNADGTITVV